MESLIRLRGLHQDLIAFTNTRLANIDRLWQQLDASIQEFRDLLDKPAPDTEPQVTVNSDKVTIGDEEFSLSPSLRDLGQTVKTSLGLNSDIEGVKLILQTQGTNIEPGEELIYEVIRCYHDRRDFLLQDLRIILQEAVGREADDGLQERFHDIANEILNLRTGQGNGGSLFLRKCLSAMNVIETRQTEVAQLIGGKHALAGPGPAVYQSLEFQKASLFKQHEALAAIVTCLFRRPYAVSDDLRVLIQVPKRWQQLDFHLFHYLPCFSAAFRQFGAPDHSSTKPDAVSLGQTIEREEAQGVHSNIQPFYAVLSLWWVVEHSGWFRDSEQEGPDVARRTDRLKKSLQDNALELLLSLCSSMNFEAWRHPARQEIVSLLLSESHGLHIEEEPISDFFQVLFMESLESFAEAWITNMPDSIRELKTEEDQQRLLHLTAMHDTLQQTVEPDLVARLHLESFLVLISFGLENRPVAAEEMFWQDPDGNLFGFLQWASKRQTVPRVSAFCEMLCAISEGPACAEAAHKFLLDETLTATSTRARRNPSMSYQQMFAELELYSRKVHERPSASQVPQLGRLQSTEMNEVESPIMLACYLRLLAHMCRQTRLTRELLFGNNASIPQSLLMLCSGPIPSYLRGSIFETLNALLTEKTIQICFDMWRMVDAWVANATTPASPVAAKTEKVPTMTVRTMQTTFSSIAASFDQADAFLVLLCTLMSSSPEDAMAGSMLVFPADLGASYRSPGITPYVDFVLGQVFAKLSSESHDYTHMKVLALSCLDFAAQCLESFNEGYIALLGRTQLAQSHQDASSPISPALYAQVHPFARCMRWLFSEGVNKNLMAASSVEADDLISVNPQSPLIPGLERALDVLILVLDLQPTYLDIVRPFVSDSERDLGSIPSGCDFFEDTISARPKLIHDLCAYAAAEDKKLVYKSLNLLERLSTSKRLNHRFIRSGSARSDSRRLVDMLGPNVSTDLLPVSSVLSSHLELDERELEQGFESPGYEIKDTILSFLLKCLDSQPSIPSVAHILLGFTRIGERLDLVPDGPMDKGTAVFNAILSLAQDYPDGIEEGKQSWLLHLKSLCMAVLQHLWADQISASIVISQMRRYKFLQYQFSGQDTVTRNTLWDGCLTSDPNFWFAKHAEGFVAFLEYRSALYAYAATEIRAASESRQTSSQKQCFSTLLGKSTSLEGIQIKHPNIYELFDFVDLDIAAEMEFTPLKYFTDLAYDSLMSEATDDTPSLYLLDSIHALLRLEVRSKCTSTTNKPTADEEIEMVYETDYIVSILRARNRHLKVQYARRLAIHNWVEVIIAALQNSPIEAVQKVQFILQTLQTILPKFDTFILNNFEDSFELARAADALLLSLSQIPSDQVQERTTNIITDRLFQLFRICVEGITKTDSSSALRNLLYNICSQYLTRITGPSDTDRKARRNCLDCVRSTGPNVVSILSDDAEDGLDACKPAALNLLGLLISLARNGKSSFMVDALTRSNTLEILIDPIKYLATEFQESEPAARKYLLTVLGARMLLLLQISRTREGAAAMLEAGLLAAVRESMIFRADPDIGLSLDNPTALHTYYELVSSILRLLVSTFISRGTQNEQCQFLIRSFLQDYRANMVGLFKRYNGVSVNGKANRESQEVLGEAVRCYTGLCAMSGFVEAEIEDNGGIGRVGGSGFS